MTVKFPKDQTGITIPVLGLGPNHQVPIGPKPAEWGPVDAEMVVILCPTVDCRVEIKPGAKATEKSTPIPAKMWVPVKILPTHRVSVVWDGADEGMLDITEAT